MGKDTDCWLVTCSNVGAKSDVLLELVMSHGEGAEMGRVVGRWCDNCVQLVRLSGTSMGDGVWCRSLVFVCLVRRLRLLRLRVELHESWCIIASRCVGCIGKEKKPGMQTHAWWSGCTRSRARSRLKKQRPLGLVGAEDRPAGY